MNVVVHAPAIVADVGPIGLHRYACQFLRAGLAYKPDDAGFSPVPYYLICRSIELSLKSFLLARGVRRSELKLKLRHDLMKLLEKAESLCLKRHVRVSREERKVLQDANSFYVTKKFEYFEDLSVFYITNLPSLDVLSKLAKRLAEKLEAVCLRAVNRYS